MIYFAHRGASARRVQNTLEAFRLARRLGASCYELDVHLTQDGQLVVHHDYSLLATAGKDAKIGELPWAQLRRCALQNRFDGAPAFIPLLQEVLPVVAPGLELLNIELKNDANCYPGLEEKLLKLLAGEYAELLPKTLFSSFDYDTLLRIRKLNKNARIGLLTRSFDVSKALDLQAESVHLNYTRFSPATAAECHQNGLKTYLYTVNDISLAKRLQQEGADGIFTDYIDLFVSEH